MTPVEVLYERACKMPSDINEHLPTFVALCEELHAKFVIELGVRSGVSTVAWLHGLTQTGGALWSVDISPPPDLPPDRWVFLRGDDRSPIILDLLPHPVDIVFIDTSHEFGHTATELELYRPLVRPGGRIVLHDTEVELPDGINSAIRYPVRTAIDRFCRAWGWAWSNREHNNGLGIIEVPA